MDFFQASRGTLCNSCAIMAELSAPLLSDPERSEEEILLTAAAEAPTIGAFQEELRRSIQTLSLEPNPPGELLRGTVEWSSPRGAIEDDPAAVPFPGSSAIISALGEHARALKEAGAGFERVQLAHDLPPGVLGMNVVGGDQAVVRSELVVTPRELHRTLLHEVVGHGGQAAPKVPNPHVALIINSVPWDVLRVLEGDAEREAAKGMGEGAGSPRPGQPEEVYGEGQRLVVGLIGEVGEGLWEETVRGSGNYAPLQVQHWEGQLRREASPQTLERVLKEGELTGYLEEARELVGGAWRGSGLHPEAILYTDSGGRTSRREVSSIFTRTPPIRSAKRLYTWEPM
jgi:hypothetical protein